MISYMHKMIFRLALTQRKFVSRSLKSNQHEMMLYNEKPQKSKSLIVRVDDSGNKKLFQTNEVKAIMSGNSRLLFLFNTNCFVLYKDTETVPVIEELVEGNEMPVIGFKDLFTWYAKTKDSGGKPPGHKGIRVGRLDAANEAGFFHRTERSRLKELKKKLKDKVKGDPTEPKKTG